MWRPFSLFPEYFDFSLAGVFLLRGTVGLLFIWDGYKKINIKESPELKGPYSKVFGVIEIIIGICVSIGLFMQLAVLFGVIISVLQILRAKKTTPYSNTPFYILLLISSFSLFLLGPGIFAIDLPL